MSTRRAGANDAVIGKNIYVYRLARQMSQTRLGEAIGVTFQQCRNTRRARTGLDRRASCLLRRRCRSPLAALFRGVPGAGGAGRNADAAVPDLLANPHRLRLARAFALIDDKDVSRYLTLLTESVARSNGRGRA